MKVKDSLIGLVTNAFRASGDLLPFADEVDARVTKVDFDALKQLAAELPREVDRKSEDGKVDDEITQKLAASESATLAEEQDVLERRKREILEALSTLPAVATRTDELAWIESHPAMLRMGDGPFIIEAADILYPPHGACPSRSAANQLGHWINNRSEFFRLLEKSPRQGEGHASDEAVNEDPKVEEIEEMLLQLRSQTERAIAADQLESAIDALEKGEDASDEVPIEVLQESAERLASISARLSTEVARRKI